MKSLIKEADLPILLLFAGSVLVSAIGGSSVVKLAFPALATIMALVFGLRNPPRYLRLLLWTLILSAGLRHFVDFHVGYSQTNPITLTPYLIAVAATPSVLLYLLRGRSYAVEFLILIALILLALGTTLATGATVLGLMTAMYWLTPIWVALYVCAHAHRLMDMRESVYRTLRFALPLVAIYGFAQFVDIAPWDAYFMTSASGFDSIGYPVPFAVRVFATMNSPGALATMLSSGLMLLLPTTRGLRWTAILLGAGTLMLTTQRAALAGLFVAVVVLMVIGRDRVLRRGIVKMVMAVALVCGVMLAIPGAAKKIISTASSVTELNHDDSAQARLQQYHDVIPMLDDHTLGRGLGWSANPAYSNTDATIPLDSGLIDILVCFGLPGGLLFLGIISVLMVSGLRIAMYSPHGGAVAELGAAIFGLVQLPFGSQQTAIAGMFLFLALGLLLGRGVSQQGEMGRRPQPRLRLGLPHATAKGLSDFP